MIFKPNEEVILTTDWEALRPFNAHWLAGKRVVIVCREEQNNIDGYNIEYIDKYGTPFTYFIPSDHLIPAPSRSNSIQEPHWKQVSNKWQKKLWKDKMEINND